MRRALELREKKPQRCRAAERAEAGDMGDHTAIAAESKLVGSLVIGKRTLAQTQTLVNDAKSRLRPGHLPAVCTETYAGSESALLEAFGRRYPQPRHGAKGRASQPIIRGPQGLASGQGQKIYQGRRVERVEVRAVSGKARLQHVLSLLGYKAINTSVVERQNGTSRLRNQRTVRKTLAFSTATRYHCWMSWLSVGLYNFCRGHGSVKSTQEAHVQHRSPAMAAKLTDHIWSTREWLLSPVLGR